MDDNMDITWVDNAPDDNGAHLLAGPFETLTIGTLKKPGIIDDFVRNSEFLAEVTELSSTILRKCPLVHCISAQLATHTGSGLQYLQLPPRDDGDGRQRESCWDDDGQEKLPGNKLLVRPSYIDIANILLDETRIVDDTEKTRNKMILSGTSGMGKSYFTRFFVWYLLHPPAGFKVPETIVWGSTQSGDGGCLYYKGALFTTDKLQSFISARKHGARLLDSTDSWLIFDGPALKDIPECRCLMVSSPGNLQRDEQAIKSFSKSSTRIYLPPWSIEELIIANEIVYNIPATTNTIQDLINRFSWYGGNARYVLQYKRFLPWTPALVTEDERVLLRDVIGDAVNTGRVIQIINELGLSELAYSEASGVLLQVTPDETYRKFTNEWASYRTMRIAFTNLFKVGHKIVQCIIGAGSSVHLGSFLGILYEPWIFDRIEKQGFQGRMRKLTNRVELREIRKKRTVFGGPTDELGIVTYKIPPTETHTFYFKEEIIPDRLNRPESRNYPSIDAIYPSRGEMYQFTVSDSHPVKTPNLNALKSQFAEWLKTHDSVKLIFIVPPERFETFTIQPYVEPRTRRKKGKGKGKEAQDDDSDYDTDEEQKVNKKSDGEGDVKGDEQGHAAGDGGDGDDGGGDGGTAAASGGQRETRGAKKNKEEKAKKKQTKEQDKKNAQEMKKKEKAARKKGKKVDPKDKTTTENDPTPAVPREEDADAKPAVKSGFDGSWIEQWALEFDVSPLAEAANLAALKEVKRARPSGILASAAELLKRKQSTAPTAVVAGS